MANIISCQENVTTEIKGSNKLTIRWDTTKEGTGEHVNTVKKRRSIQHGEIMRWKTWWTLRDREDRMKRSKIDLTGVLGREKRDSIER